MKKIMSTSAFVLSLFATSAFAKEPFIYVVNSHSKTGTTNTIAQALKHDLKNYYNKVEFIHGGGCARTSRLVRKKLDKPTYFLWMGVHYGAYLDGSYPACPMKINKKSFVKSDIMYSRLIVKNESNLNIQDFNNHNKTYHIGYIGSLGKLYKPLIKSLDEKFPSDIKSVPYKSSSKVLQAIIVGEIDAGLNLPSLAIKNKDKVKSLATTKPDGIENIPPLKKFIDNPTAKAGMADFYLLKNASKNEVSYFRNVLKKIYNNPSSKTYQWYKNTGYQNTIYMNKDKAFNKSMKIVNKYWRD